MAISRVGGTGSDNWELISSVTPTAASAAVNFTGLSVYRKLAIRFQGIVLGTSGNVTLRLNNDSGSLYDATFQRENTTRVNLVAEFNQTAFNLSSTDSSLNHNGFIQIDNCDNAGLKISPDGFKAAGSILINQHYGQYRASAIITQVNLITNTTFTAVGTVALYGVK